MKCNICRGDSHNERLDEIVQVQKNWICWNCWYKTIYHSYTVRDMGIRDANKGTSNRFTTIEYFLVCLECQHQTGYGYLWFAIQDGRENILSSGHKSVTISEIVWQGDKLMGIIRIDIKFLLSQNTAHSLCQPNIS